MANYINAPLCSYPGTVFPLHEESFESYKAHHLAGPTVTKFPTLKSTTPRENATIDRFSQDTVFSSVARARNMHSKRPPSSSSTKSQLRQSNKKLLQMLQDVQTELNSHKTMMQDMQSRIEQLERNAAATVAKSTAKTESTVADDTPVEAVVAVEIPQPKAKPVNTAVPAGHEDFTWWEACQRFVDSGTPFSAQGFMKKSEEPEDFDFHYGGLPTNSSAMVAALPPAVTDLPSLTPTTESAEDSQDEDSQDEESQQSTPVIPSRKAVDDLTLITSLEDGFEYDDIVESIVEFSRPQVLRPLLLHPPPTGRSTSDLSMETITALPSFPTEPEITEPSKRQQKGFRGLYKKLARSKSSDEKVTPPSLYLHRGA